MPTGDSGPFGGNMDFNEIVEGTTVYSPRRSAGRAALHRRRTRCTGRRRAQRKRARDLDGGRIHGQCRPIEAARVPSSRIRNTPDDGWTWRNARRCDAAGDGRNDPVARAGLRPLAVGNRDRSGKRDRVHDWRGRRPQRCVSAPSFARSGLRRSSDERSRAAREVSGAHHDKDHVRRLPSRSCGAQPRRPRQRAARGVTAEDYFAFETLERSALLARRLDDRVRRHDRRSETESAAQRRSGRCRPTARASRSSLTTAPQSSNSPRWSPDGKAIAFLSARPAPGDATRHAAHAGLAAAARRRRAAARDEPAERRHRASSGPRTARGSSSSAAADRATTAKSPSDVRHYAHANYKFNDTGWFDDKRAHLWVVDVASGRATQITSGDDWNDTRSAVVARRPEDRVRVRPHGQGVRRRAQHGRLGDRRERRPADEDFRSRRPATTRRAGRPTARRSRSSARCRKNRTRRSGWRRRPAVARRGLRPTALDLIPVGAALGRERQGAVLRDRLQGHEPDLSRRSRGAQRAAAVTSGDRTYRICVDINDEDRNRLAYAVNDPTHLDDLYVADLERPEREAADAPQRRAVEAAAARRRSSACRYKGADGWDVDGFFMKPVGWEAGQEVPDDPDHSRRPGRAVRLRLVSRVPGLRRARLGGVLHQPARLDRLRREVRARHRAELGRQGLRRRHERRRRGAREVSVDRHAIASASPAAATAAT